MRRTMPKDSRVGWLLPSCYDVLQRANENVRAGNKQVETMGESLVGLLTKRPLFLALEEQI